MTKDEKILSLDKKGFNCDHILQTNIFLVYWSSIYLPINLPAYLPFLLKWKPCEDELACIPYYVTGEQHLAHSRNSIKSE